MTEETAEKPSYPIMALAQLRFKLMLSKGEDEALKNQVQQIVTENRMAPYCLSHLTDLNLTFEPNMTEQMQQSIAEEVAKFDDKIQDAILETSVKDALLEKAQFLTQIGHKDKALDALKDAYEKTVGVGGKLDNILTAIRIGFFFDDLELAKKEIDRAKTELGKGGDWERRNKLKVYEGMYLMSTRRWGDAAKLFLNVMPTFTATELVEFKDFIAYTVILTMVALDRPTMREKLVSSPEVLAVIKETPHLQEFMDSFFSCQYRDFMVHFVPIIDFVRADRFLAPHCRYFMRIMRLNAYKQFLASYRSVELTAMGQEFGVSDAFIDVELSSFISSGKLSCKIDKVGGVIESNTDDRRSQVYVDIIKQGDLLLNRMQKLAGAIDM